MSEKKQFKTESRRMLELMIGSVYTHREIFLRELISNASDAIDKLCCSALADGTAGLRREDFAITLTLDKERRLLTVSDNGVGMSAEELEEDLGVIAFSGSRLFRQESDGAENGAELIGQFGVGFYSAFLAADRVEVVSRRYGAEEAFRWASSGVDGYTVTPAERAGHGTDVVLHIRPDGEERDEYSRYLREYPLWKLVKKYSDYIRFPIKMLMPHPRVKEGSSPDAPEYEEVMEYETLNSMVPLWQRQKGEVAREDCNRFYQERYGDPRPPRNVLTVSAEGAVSYKALLFIPAEAPAPYGTPDWKSGLELYSAGVLIMDRCDTLLPDCFNFVRGVVDSPDLSLNISRETLQQDGQVKRIAANLEKKVRAELERLLKTDRAGYEEFYKSFGRQLKHCALDDDEGARREWLKELLMFHTSAGDGLTILGEYVDRMPPDQKYIYCAAGRTAAEIAAMPQTELLRERGYELLCFTDKVDEFIPGLLRTYRDKPFRSATDGDLGLEDSTLAPKKAGAHRDTLNFVKAYLGGRVDEVIPSARLKTHPVCMSSGSGITFEMEKYFTANQPERKMRAKRILELNVDHPAFAALERARLTDPVRAEKYAEILYSQGMLLAGMPLENMSDYTDLLCGLW